MELLEDNRTLYIQCNQVDRDISEFLALLSEFAKTHSLERCIIDLRNNLGGDDRYVWKSQRV